MNMIDEIKKISSLSAVSGFEQNVSDYLTERFKKLCDDVKIDSLGNVIALKKSKSGSGRVMLEAHIDEIGMIVKSIDENGFLLGFALCFFNSDRQLGAKPLFVSQAVCL